MTYRLNLTSLFIEVTAMSIAARMLLVVSALASMLSCGGGDTYNNGSRETEIGSIETRDFVVRILSDGSAHLYTVCDKNGAILSDRLTKEQLERDYPRLKWIASNPGEGKFGIADNRVPPKESQASTVYPGRFE